MQAKTVTVVIDENGNSTIDLAGFQGNSCAKVAEDFRGSDRVTKERATTERDRVVQDMFRRGVLLLAADLTVVHPGLHQAQGIQVRLCLGKGPLGDQQLPAHQQRVKADVDRQGVEAHHRRAGGRDAPVGKLPEQLMADGGLVAAPRQLGDLALDLRRQRRFRPAAPVVTGRRAAAAWLGRIVLVRRHWFHSSFSHGKRRGPRERGRAATILLLSLRAPKPACDTCQTGTPGRCGQPG